ncbi:MAG: CapA family protein [Chloroflexota bacterium]
MAQDQSVTLALTGDSMITRGVSRSRDSQVRAMIDQIQSADVAFTNLESLPNDFKGEPSQHSGGTHMAAHGWVIDELTAMGFDLLAAATNHNLDYSIGGLVAAIENLDSRGACFAGIGRNLAEARMPAYFDGPAGSVAMISCCSTSREGQQAADQRPEIQGRPGLNPVRYSTTYQVTEQQMEMLVELANQLSVEQQRQERIRLGFLLPPEDPDIFPFLGSDYRVGDEVAVQRGLKQRDVYEIGRWVRDAKMRAHLVIASLHAHEQADDKETPAEFIPEFAHAMIDEGADVDVGHGPHLLRGMEIYKGKPIFYSLGNFIAQNDLVYKMPADAYERFKVEPTATPAELFDDRSKSGTSGFPADPRYWQTVMPVCRFTGGQLAEVELHPISLRYGEPVHTRGWPRLAEGEEATEILHRFAALSKPFGTKMTVEGERSAVRLDD